MEVLFTMMHAPCLRQPSWGTRLEASVLGQPFISEE